jgi:hypothetical protein
MSIAISAVIKSSQILFCVAYGMCFGLIVVGAAVGMGLVSYFSFVARIFIAGFSVICALFAIFHIMRQKIVFMIDISGIGKIRLMQHDYMYGAVRAGDVGDWGDGDGGELVRLIGGSTLWPGMMFLRLKSESGRVWILRILPDSVSPQEFRALSVAFRWIAARTSEADKTLQSE